MSGRFIAVVGPSGVGKDSVMRAMAAAAPRLHLVRRVITRPAEAGGEAFEGVDAQTFEARRAAGAFALSWDAHGLRYGIPAGVDAALARGQDLLANLSRAALPTAHRRFPGFRVIALHADHDVLAARLASRGREDATQIGRRLARADFALPEGIDALHLDNSGPLEATVRRALDALYPVRA